MQQRYNPISGEFDLIEVTSTGTAGRLVKFGANDDSVVNSLLNQVGSNIALDSGKFITSESGVIVVDFGTTGSEFWSLDAASNTYGKGWVYGDISFAQLGFGSGSATTVYNADVNGTSDSSTDGTNSASVYTQRGGGSGMTSADGTNGVSIENTPTSAKYGSINHIQLELIKNSGAAATSTNTTKYASFLGSQNSVIADGVENSVMLGGSGLYGKTAGVAYLNKIGYATGSTNETLLQFTAPTGNRTITFEDATGRVLTASAVTTEAVASDTTLTIVYSGVTYKLLARA